VSSEMREAYAALPDKLIALYKQPEQEIRYVACCSFHGRAPRA